MTGDTFPNPPKTVDATHPFAEADFFKLILKTLQIKVGRHMLSIVHPTPRANYGSPIFIVRSAFSVGQKQDVISNFSYEREGERAHRIFHFHGMDKIINNILLRGMKLVRRLIACNWNQMKYV